MILALFLAGILSSPAYAQTNRQNVMEYLAAALEKDGAYSADERRILLDAIRVRFADYSIQVVPRGRPEGVQVVMRMIIEGHFDEAPAERIAEVAFAAYQAVSRGAPAEVVEGIALYGYRKKIPGDRISVWANGYRQMTDAKVPPDVAADLIRNAMEKDWDDKTFDTLKWALVQGVRDRFDIKNYATYLFGHMAAGNRKPGELTGAARSYFKKIARGKAAPQLPAYEGTFTQKPKPPIVYEAKPTPEPEPKPAQKSEPKSQEKPRPKQEAPVRPPVQAQTPKEMGLEMRSLWPGLENSSKSYLGTPYVWGGTTHRGIDCSALTQNSYGENKVGIPRVSRQQWNTGKPVEYSDLREGDLVFFNTMGVGVSHVGMVVSSKGPEFIHASSSKGVMIAELSKKYYKTRYLGARRVVP